METRWKFFADVVIACYAIRSKRGRRSIARLTVMTGIIIVIQTILFAAYGATSGGNLREGWRPLLFIGVSLYAPLFFICIMTRLIERRFSVPDAGKMGFMTEMFLDEIPDAGDSDWDVIEQLGKAIKRGGSADAQAAMLAIEAHGTFRDWSFIPFLRESISK